MALLFTPAFTAAGAPTLNDGPGNMTVDIQIERDGFDYLVFAYTVPDSVNKTKTWGSAWRCGLTEGHGSRWIP